ncbi:hypothetical protein [Haloarcula onubensis]|uniref:Uncharacterized protein n=1 Tax=Haloarcula onubensis TaxID=2950539 RepID=A0ABU2FR26_9EURY|nr:hypothetical protein [Halomicroarcula sp. S3CR25-11]MDS0283213.1 hypothetical protein [Halomicroarcula sp. S3CR25-11]
MVGPSITKDDREKFLVQLKVGFALLVGGSMALVALWGASGPLVALGVGVAATLVGGVLAHFTFPDSIAETPYEDDRERGPKPGTRMRERRERSDGGETEASDRNGPR